MANPIVIRDQITDTFVVRPGAIDDVLNPGTGSTGSQCFNVDTLTALNNKLANIYRIPQKRKFF